MATGSKDWGPTDEANRAVRLHSASWRMGSRVLEVSQTAMGLSGVVIPLRIGLR